MKKKKTLEKMILSNTLQYLSLIFSCVILLCNCHPKAEQEANDSNTPLHLLQPTYQNPYDIPSEESIMQALDRTWAYLDKETPTQVIDATTGNEIIDYSKIDRNSVLKSGAFRLTSYEWGVTYAGMTLIGEVTGDMKYSDYTTNRLQFLSETAPYFRKLINDKTIQNPQLRQLLTPQALDDCGSMCTAFIKASYQENTPDYKDIINNYIDWIMNGQMRLSDGTFARNRPQLNTLWLDDMFMSIPALAWMGKSTGENRFYDEVVKQIRQFASRMFIPEKNLFTHGWVEAMDDQPAFFWGRANGWAIMALVEALEVLPKEHEGYQEVMSLLKKHIKGLVTLQSGEGLWHQLLDKNDSYLETSASAIYVYAIARSINNGWIDAKRYGPCTVLAWNAVSKQINEFGQVTGTCVGTGMAFDPAFYYYRPVNVYAAHGYGPVLLAGGEMIILLSKTYPKMNDNTLHFYDKEVKTDLPTFEIKP